METLYQILGLLGAAMIVFVMYSFVKNNPGRFSKENLNNSFFTIGVLALILIGFVALLIVSLR